MRNLIIVSLALILASIPLSGMAHSQYSKGQKSHYYQKYQQSYHSPYYKASNHDGHYRGHYGKCKSPYYKVKSYGHSYKTKYHSKSKYHRGSYYGHHQATPVTKFVAGVGEVAFSWTEVPAAIVNRTREQGPAGVVYGFGEGVVLGLYDIAEGIVDGLLFAVPPYRPVELPPYGPERGENILGGLKEADAKFRKNWW